MRYTDRELKRISPSEWAILYRQPTYAVVAESAHRKWVVLCSWVGVVYDLEPTPKTFVVQSWNSVAKKDEGRESTVVRQDYTESWHVTEESALMQYNALTAIGESCGRMPAVEKIRQAS